MKNFAIAFGLVFGLGVVTGCSVSLEQPTPSVSVPGETDFAENDEPTEQQATEQPAQTSPVPSHSYPSSTHAANEEFRRSYYAESIDVTLGCPTGELVLAKDLQIVRVTEDCRKITVASSATVLAEHVDSLIVTPDGGAARVILRSANSIVVDGNLCHVWWDEGRPKTVRVSGIASDANPNPAPEP